jgi:hypothetical protein
MTRLSRNARASKGNCLRDSLGVCSSSYHGHAWGIGAPHETEINPQIMKAHIMRVTFICQSLLMQHANISKFVDV